VIVGGSVVWAVGQRILPQEVFFTLLHIVKRFKTCFWKMAGMRCAQCLFGGKKLAKTGAYANTKPISSTPVLEKTEDSHKI
jgi:hypothetical protein